MADATDIGILLALAYQQFVDELRAALAAEGVHDQGRSDGYVLRAVAAGPVTVSELAERLAISKQGAGQIVDDMVGRGYLERYPDPDDGRARLLRLSPYGRDVLAAARRFHRGYERRLRRTHGAEQVATLRAMLEAIAGADTETVRALHV
jgi:DNA-binding MarR family transcriptional regulator